MAERSANLESVSGRSRSGTASIVSASLAALASLLATVACCIPVLPLALAAGFAGMGTFLSAARPYFMAASVILVAFGFYQAARAKKCRRRSVAASVLLWFSALMVAASIFFPQWVANILANLTAGWKT